MQYYAPEANGLTPTVIKMLINYDNINIITASTLF